MSALAVGGYAVLSIVTGGAAGYLSSVYAAGPVARRQHAAVERIAAEQAIIDAVTDYLGRIRASELTTQFVFPADYADPGGRRQLADTILSSLPHLNGTAADEIRGILTQLIGRRGMRDAVLREGVPAAARPGAEALATEDEHVERMIRMGYHEGVGCKSETLHLCERDHYPQVRDEHGTLGLLRLVLGHPHSRMRPQVQAEVIVQLNQILDIANPRRVRAREDARIRTSVRNALPRRLA